MDSELFWYVYKFLVHKLNFLITDCLISYFLITDSLISYFLNTESQ